MYSSAFSCVRVSVSESSQTFLLFDEGRVPRVPLSLSLSLSLSS